MNGYISLLTTAILTALVVGGLLLCLYLRGLEVEQRATAQIETVEQAYKMILDKPTAAGKK